MAAEANRVPGWEMEVLGEMPGTAQTNVLGHMDKGQMNRGSAQRPDTQSPTLTSQPDSREEGRDCRGEGGRERERESESE